MTKKRKEKTDGQVEIIPESEQSAILEFDLNQLEREWNEHPNVFNYWARQLEDDRYRLGELENQLDLIVAEVGLDIRRSPPEDHGLDKYTEGAIKNIIALNKNVQRKESTIRKWTHRVAIVRVFVDSLKSKQRAMEKTVDLHGQNYFSVPTAKSDNGRKSAEKMERGKTRKGVKKSKKKRV